MFELQTQPNADIFRSGCEAIVNATNTHGNGRGGVKGLMGGGLAAKFARTFPGLDAAYYDVCRDGNFTPGQVHVWENPAHRGDDPNAPKYIINFPTKRAFPNPSELVYVSDGLSALTVAIAKHDIRSIAIPALGCGLGGLDWKIVRAIIEGWATTVVPDVLVKVFPPQ